MAAKSMNTRGKNADGEVLVKSSAALNLCCDLISDEPKRAWQEAGRTVVEVGARRYHIATAAIVQVAG